MSDSPRAADKNRHSCGSLNWLNISQKRTYARWTDEQIERLCSLRSCYVDSTWDKVASVYNTPGVPYRTAKALSNKYRRVS
ncbi:hypothetical protein MPH_13892, partial [Macrophomina phaseolina MS6]